MRPVAPLIGAWTLTEQVKSLSLLHHHLKLMAMNCQIIFSITKKNNFQPATYWLFVWWVVCWFRKANMLTSGPELDMIWTDLTGDGAERERRRMLTNPEALLKIWRILHWPLGRPRNIMMTFDLWLTEPLAQGFVMAYGLGPMKDGSWPCWRWKCLIGHNVSPIQHSVPGQLLWKDDVSGKTRQWWQGGGSCAKVLSKAGSRPF